MSVRLLRAVRWRGLVRSGPFPLWLFAWLDVVWEGDAIGPAALLAADLAEEGVARWRHPRTQLRAG